MQQSHPGANAPHSTAGRIAILMYHIVDRPLNDIEAHFCCTPDRFAKQMNYLASSNLTVMKLNDVYECISGSRDWPSRGVAITFDDGYQCIRDFALPVLERNRIPATLFVVAGRIGQTGNWDIEMPARKILDWPGLREISERGISIGCHSLTHPKLPEIPLGQYESEFKLSRRLLEDGLGQPVNHFAYPYGRFNESVKAAIIEAGYHISCSTQPGFNATGADPFSLRRIEICGKDSLSQIKRKLKYGTNSTSSFLPVRYYSLRLLSKLIHQ
ncbi:MAG: polysaccharide deacetylase family protein [Acidobacteria bacterium]|nr:polysaccharide deacetylase family protein [Acidobacteriota bacterium]